MVLIAVAGSSGSVAKEAIDGILSTKRHEILLLSTKDFSAGPASSLVRREKTTYEDKKALAATLIGVHTVLCFITPQTDPGNVAQKALIDACVLAGVKRYAPSEWATSSFEYMPWYSGKAEIRSYLENLNSARKVLEYCLFQPGMFTNYFAAPYKTSKHIHPFQQHIDFNQRRALGLEGGDGAKITLTTVQDFVAVVVKAVEYEGEWPVVGGIKGDELTFGELYALGGRVRNGAIQIERLQKADLLVGTVKASWLPRVDHPAIPADQVDVLSKSMTAGMILGMSVGVMSVSDDWNKLLPDYKFTSAADFLSLAWAGKP